MKTIANEENCLQFVTVRYSSNEGATFDENAFGPTNKIKLLQCYEGSPADYMNEAFSDKKAYLSVDPDVDPDAEPATVTFMASETEELSTATANGAVTMPGAGTAAYGERAFAGWSTSLEASEPAFNVGETYPIFGTVKLYPVWKNVVKFYDEDETTLLGTYVDNNSGDANVICENVQIPNKSGKAFLGFYKDDNKYFYFSGNQWDCNNHISRPNDFDENGVCKLVAKWTEVDDDVFVGRSVSLDGVIRLNVYVQQEKGGEITAYDTDVESKEARGGKTREIEVKSSVEVGGNTYDKVSIKIYAKEMADNIRVSCYDWSSGALISKTYSVKEYLETLAQDAETYAEYTEKASELRDICYATLNYGAAAQTYFNHKTELLANENVPSSYVPEQPTDLTYDAGSQGDYGYVNLSYYASNMGLFADTSYALCFEYLGEADEYSVGSNAPYLYYFAPVPDDADGEGYDYYNGVMGYWTGTSAQAVGYREVDDPENGTGYRHIMAAYLIPNIAAKDLLNDIPVYFQAQEGTRYNDDEYITTFSPKTYIAKVLNAAGVNPDYTDGQLQDGGTYNSKEQQEMNNLVKTVRAIYDYSKKASAYFG